MLINSIGKVFADFERSGRGVVADVLYTLCGRCLFFVSFGCQKKIDAKYCLNLHFLVSLSDFLDLASYGSKLGKSTHHICCGCA